MGLPVELRWVLRGEENVVDARVGAEAITTRIGAVALPLGIILFVVSTAVFHPNREAPMDNPPSLWSTPTVTAGLQSTSPSGSLLYF